MAGQQPADANSLWFNPPGDGNGSRRVLTRERVVAEALTVISTDGAPALSMRALAARLGVVPSALYRHVRNKEQLYDLILDAVLADPTSPAEQRLRDTVTRQQLQAFLRSLPASSFPALVAHGIHAWAGDRDQRFASGLDTFLRGLQAKYS